jgi:hypothetical protein
MGVISWWMEAKVRFQGKNINKIKVMTIAMIKMLDPLYILVRSIFPAALTTKQIKPTGGKTNPIMIIIAITTPYQIGSNPSLRMRGKLMNQLPLHSPWFCPRSPFCD